jgi:mono/diheme cytochrome c family protein
MLRRFVAVLVLLALIGAGAFWFLTIPASVAASALGSHVPSLENGKVMFYAGGCASCHATPGQDDKTRLGGGVAIKSPFGTFYAPNISSDPNEGIGKWSEANFLTALMKGTSPDGRHYYPAFPYTSYQRIGIGDARDLFAYLKTLGGWKFLFLDGRPWEGDPSHDVVWNRGAYLINGPGHCAECHSPRNFLGGIVTSQRFAGGPDPSGDGFIPNITQKELGNWSVKDIADMLDTGMTPDDKVGGAMAEVVSNASHLSAKDREAMATYIKSLPPVEGPKPPDDK